MKNLLLVPISVLSVFSRVTKSNNNPFESITITPLYEYGENSTIVVKSRASNFRITVYLDNDRYSGRQIVNTTINGSGNFSFTYNNSYTRIKNQLYVALTYNNVTTYSERIDMNVTSSGYDVVNTHQEITSDSYLAVLNDDFNWEKKKATYTFNNFEDYYIPDYFHKFDFGNFYISVPEEQRKFFGCNAKLVITYKNGVFDNLAGAENGFVELPLKRRLTNGNFYFSLEKNIYVDPITLAVASDKLSGYVQTRHIYFPRNSMQNQEDYYCYFVFSKFGLDKDLVYHYFSIRALRNIVGDCHNSKYCVQKLYK